MGSRFSTAEIQTWYKHEPGATLWHMECSQLQKILPNHFGYYLLQLGTSPSADFLDASPIHNYINLAPDINQTNNANSCIQSNFDELPLQSGSIDLAIVLHVLEFAANPRLVLHEIYNALIPGGSAIIFCFNPHSLWGLKQFGKNPKAVPWHGKFIPPWRMQRWLTKTGFSVGDYQTFFFRPALDNKYLLHKLKFLETIGAFLWPYFGASYMYVVRKLVVGMHMLVTEKPRETLIATPSTATRLYKTYIDKQPQSNK